jgi:hypothetical protein
MGEEMEGKWVKGPWRVQPIEMYSGGMGIAVVNAEGETIADNQTYYPQALAEKNAHLVAAAPEMYEALEALITRFGWITDLEDIHQAQRVLRKARGED